MLAQQLQQVFQQSLSSNVSDIREAERLLGLAEANTPSSDLALALLSIVLDQHHPASSGVRQAGAIFFKNLIKRKWSAPPPSRDPSEEVPVVAVIPDADKERIREALLRALCSSTYTPPKTIQAQILAAVTTISEVDFPEKWPPLLSSLVQSLNSAVSVDHQLLVLNTLAAVFKKYRSSARSDGILMELKYLLPLFQETHLTVAKSLLQNVGSVMSPTSTPSMEAMQLVIEIFYSLNVVDIPEFYQDNIKTWMNGLLEILTCATSSTSEEETEIEKLRAMACDCLCLYSDKYQEVFEPFVARAVTAMWGLLIQFDHNLSRFDHVVASGIRFLSSCCSTKWASSPFEESGALQQICEKLILPNVQLRDADIELFEDNPDEFIRRDIEGADQETRRRCAIDLVRSLSKFYEPQVTETLVQYVHNLLTKFAGNWRAKDACVYLITATASRGETRAAGVSQLNAKVDIVNFFTTHLLPEITANPITNNPVLRASILKFLVSFRSQLPAPLLRQCLSSILAHLHPSAPRALQVYAAHAVSQILPQFKGQQVVEEAAVANALKAAVQGIIIGRATDSAAGHHSDYVMRAVLRLIQSAVHKKSTALSPNALIIAHSTLGDLMQVMARVVGQAAGGGGGGDANSHAFVHLLFESIALLVSAVSPSNPQETCALALLPLCRVLEEAGGATGEDFMSYALQVLAVLLDNCPTKHEAFMRIHQPMLSDALWATRASSSNVPGLVRILGAYLNKADLYPVDEATISVLLCRRFPSLLASAKFEQSAFDLLGDVLHCAPLPHLQPSLSGVLRSILMRIHTHKSDKTKRMFAVALSVLAGRGAEATQLLFQCIESIQANLSVDVLRELWTRPLVAFAQAEGSGMDGRRRLALTAFTQLINSASVRAQAPLLTPVVGALQALLASAPTAAADEGNEQIPHIGEQTYEVAFAKLFFAASPMRENWFISKSTENVMATLRQSVSTHSTEIARGLQTVPEGAALSQWLSQTFAQGRIYRVIF